MARSNYVYVVQAADGAVLAVFTVKYEAQDWLDRNDGSYLVTRVPDADFPGRQPVALNPRTLEPAA